MATNHIPLDTGRAGGRDLKAARDRLAEAVVLLEGQRRVLAAMIDGEDYTGLVEAGVGQNVEQAENAFYQLDVLATAFQTPPLKDQIDQFLSYLGGN